MSQMMTAEVTRDREVHAESCPQCNGPISVNDDGWKICYACGWSSPSVAPAPTVASSVASRIE